MAERYVRNRALTRMVPILWDRLGLNKVLFRLNRGRKRVITYHNVIPDRHFMAAIHLGVSHAESVFQAQMRHLVKHHRLGTNLVDAREVAITFDDGYRNQFEVAHKILSGFSIRALFFCCLDLVQGEAPLVVDDLLCWLSYVSKGSYAFPLNIEGIPNRIEIRGEQDRANIWRNIFRYVRVGRVRGHQVREAMEQCWPYREIRRSMGEALCRLRLEPIPKHGLREMAEYGHLIGAHSRSHDAMRYLSPEELREDFEACRLQMGTVYNTRVFSYPFGGLDEVGPETLVQLRASGFDMGLANINHPIHRDAGLRYGPLFFPRMSLPNSSSKVLLDFHLSGSHHFLKYRRLLPVP